MQVPVGYLEVRDEASEPLLMIFLAPVVTSLLELSSPFYPIICLKDYSTCVT
jgi:hypothetical protein